MGLGFRTETSMWRLSKDYIGTVKRRMERLLRDLGV